MEVKFTKSDIYFAGMYSRDKQLMAYNRKMLKHMKQWYTKAIDKLQLPKRIIYYTLSHDNFNKKKTMKSSHFIKASENSIELSNLYKSLNKSVEIIPKDFNIAKQLYEPTNLLLSYYDYYQKQQKALKQDMRHRASVLHQPKCSSSIHSMFSMLYVYPSTNYDLTYSNIMKLGRAYLENKHISCKFHTTYYIKASCTTTTSNG